MFGRPPANFGPPGPFSGPGSFPPFLQPPRTGGFLSRLFGGAAGPRLGGFGGVPGSNLFGMNSGGGFLGTMQNIEKMVQLAQTVKPMIDQYGPMIKNIPSMLEVLKEYKNYSADQEEKTTKDNNTKNNTKNNKKNSNTNSPANKRKNSEQKINIERPKDKKEANNIISESVKSDHDKKQQPKGIKVVPRPKNNNKPIQKVQYRTSTPKLYI